MKRIGNWKLDIRNLEKDILNTIEYFSFFKYPPTLEEIHTFLKKKVTKQALTNILQEMKEKSLILTSSKFQVPSSKQYSRFNNQASNINSLSRYTLPEYPMHFQTFARRQKISKQKIHQIQTYVKVLSIFPQIKLVGLSGSTAMLNADKEHDVDLFIITAKNRLFTGRFIALILAELMGMRRRRHSGERKRHQNRFWTSQNDNVWNKVCLNLFFDESNLLVPKLKKSEYVGHEVIQMKPLHQKGDIYSRFIDTNRWVFDIFPNARNTKSGRTSAVLPSLRSSSTAEVNVVANLIESLLKSIQLYFIRRHKTTEIITDTQLWFHPDDFESKIKYG